MLNRNTSEPSAGTPLIVAENIEVLYGTRKRQRILDQVSFHVQQGEKFAIIGPSGCGKTTLLKAMAGFLPISAGKLQIANRAVTAPSPNRMVVFQDFEQLLPWKTVIENVVYAIQVTRPVARPVAVQQALDYLNLVNVVDASEKYPHQLSGGMKQRVAIARALAVQPQLLLLDEPFAALDALTRTQLQHEVNAIWRNTGVTIVLVTHSIQEAVYLGHRILVMNAKPGTVKAVVDTSQANDIDSDEFTTIAAHLRDLLVPSQFDAALQSQPYESNLQNIRS
ncbi:MAG: ABC transporter ATP-binding protein [Chroococcidiopsidaceae cyanobacterium CP_BM_ER_R8_30]|nr:ABC transporter ATP-binding protein [Chroococcidiopsidaceae cyanobacterium CP_BM_ER_R8_30]